MAGFPWSLNSYEKIINLRENCIVTFAVKDECCYNKTIYLPKTINSSDLESLALVFKASINNIVCCGGGITVRLIADGKPDRLFGIMINFNTGEWTIIEAEKMRQYYCTCSCCGEQLPEDGTIFIDSCDLM